MNSVSRDARVRLLTAVVGCAVIAACGGGGGGAAVSTSASIGGLVTGLPSSLPILLNNSGTETIAVPTNGAFSFAKRVPEGGTYSVNIVGLPNASRCTVINATGTVSHDTASISNVTVTCDYVTLFATTFDNFNVGVTVSGLLPGGSVTLMNNGNDAETVTATENDLFVFPIQYALQRFPGRVIDVSVRTQPSNQVCTVSNGTGPVPSPQNFVNVPVSCN